jgi:hypothetical protein
LENDAVARRQELVRLACHSLRKSMTPMKHAFGHTDLDHR